MVYPDNIQQVSRTIHHVIIVVFAGIPDRRAAVDHHVDRVNGGRQLGHVQHLRRLQAPVRHHHRRVGHRSTAVRRPGGHQGSSGVRHGSLRGRGTRAALVLQQYVSLRFSGSQLGILDADHTHLILPPTRAKRDFPRFSCFNF